MIIQKAERIKEMLLNESLILTEFAYQLEHRCVAYLSNQFKLVTGLRPTKFRDIMTKKRQSK
jgi:YesN/AraC family two-component response regulator